MGYESVSVIYAGYENMVVQFMWMRKWFVLVMTESTQMGANESDRKQILNLFLLLLSPPSF